MNFKLSKSQKIIYEKDGIYVVNACAGSGKTSTLSKKLAKLINENENNHEGIVAISFTNVAKNEINKNLNDMGIKLSYPHFLGTIDSFLNNYIFYPYYYLLDEFNKRPVLVGKPARSWNKTSNNNYDLSPDFDKITFDINGDLKKVQHNLTLKRKLKKHNKDGSLDKNYINYKNMKCRLFRRGFVTQSDIHYFSLKLLKNFPFIAKILSKKFHTFLIDEAQDTNEIQINILDIISKQEYIKNFIFIGDFNQAIFEWNGAKPELFNKISSENDSIELNENWRSSQNICEFTSKLLEKENKNSVAVNEDVKNYHFIPEIIEYETPQEAIDYFLDICNSQKDIEVTSNNISVLVRSKNLLKEIIGNSKVKNIEIDKTTKDMIYSKYLLDNNEISKAYENLEEILISIEKDDFHISKLKQKEYINTTGYFNYKLRIKELFDLMPSTKEYQLNCWIKIFKDNLHDSDYYLKDELLKNIKPSRLIIDIPYVFNENSIEYKDYQLSTIHKVKGETYDAVLLILKSKVQKAYKTMINEFIKTGKKDQELRNVYVGITRPRKILILAVPSKDKEKWEEIFVD